MHHLTKPFLLTALILTASARADSLDAKLTQLLANPQLKTASVGLDIVEVSPNGAPPKQLFSHNPTLPLGPASNCKLLTTSAAFERYGPNASFKTLLYQVGPDLVLVGGGDPALGDAKLAAEKNEKPTSPFESWATLLKSKGITTYRNLVVDDRVFDQQFFHPNWPADQKLTWYSAEIGGLNFNANCLDWIPKLSQTSVTVELIPKTSYTPVTLKAARGAKTAISLLRIGDSNKYELRGTLAASATSPYSVPIHDPGLWTGTVLKDVLTASGITCSGEVARISPDAHLANATPLASAETPVINVIRRANTNSLNMMAEGLCKRLGYDSTNGKQPGSWANGTAAVEAYAVSLGVNPQWLTLDDGSGLSSKNRVSARAFTTVLAHVATRPGAQAFIDSLAQPGEDGTLQRRFKNMKVADFVHAKTGHISGVSTLSGYIQLDQRLFAFSILCNKYQGNVNPWQDEVCEAIYNWAK